MREPDRFSEIFDRHDGDIHGYASRRLGRGCTGSPPTSSPAITGPRCASTGHCPASAPRGRSTTISTAGSTPPAQRARLAAALLEIAERDREVLLLVAWAELSCEEAARALGIPAATARSRLHRARGRTPAALAADPRSTDR